MLQAVILTSLKILAVWICFQDGMIFSGVRRLLAFILPVALHKPVFDCLTCMGGLWTVVFWLIDGHRSSLPSLMIPVIGLNYLIAIWKDQFFVPHGQNHQG